MFRYSRTSARRWRAGAIHHPVRERVAECPVGASWTQRVPRWREPSTAKLAGVNQDSAGSRIGAAWGRVSGSAGRMAGLEQEQAQHG